MEDSILVKTEKEEPYEICLTESFSGLEQKLSALGCRERRICIVTDQTVAAYYLDEVSEIAGRCCSALTQFVIPAGEAYKTLDVVRDLYKALIEAQFDRHDFLLALGGGVVGDLTGFAAATYLRGIRFIQLPTTLLSQIDASVGGKTGVDFMSYKNMVGAFHQPALVYSNVDALRTLSDEQFASGIGELLKYGLILDESLYGWIEEHCAQIRSRETPALCYVTKRCCELKRDVVERDPEDLNGGRAILNFGHTVGHAIEKLKDYALPHGVCVALGSVAAAAICVERGYLDEEDFSRICAGNRAFGLPVSFDGPAAEEVVAATKKDKKMEAGKIRFILLKKIGQAYVASDVTDREICDAVTRIRRADA